MGDLEDVLAEIGGRHQQPHQHEQRHHAELVAGDRVVARLRHERQRHVDVIANHPDADEGQHQKGNRHMQAGKDQHDHQDQRDDADAERRHVVFPTALRKSARARKTKVRQVQAEPTTVIRRIGQVGAVKSPSEPT